jgi:hypothetical protein
VVFKEAKVLSTFSVNVHLPDITTNIRTFAMLVTVQL